VLETALMKIITLSVLPSAVIISLKFDSHTLDLHKIRNFAVLQYTYVSYRTGCVTK